MNTLKFRIAAKTDMGLVRTNNEDNFQAAANLSAEQMRWVNNEVYSLGNKGALLVVADGMGGMNAGEVASALAIETVREYFTPERITDEVVKTRFTIEKFMNDVIIAADQRIKQEANDHPESRGMGTTIVIGWIFDGKLYVSWCGDSRAYIYNPEAGLHQITKDHSYVQGLVDKGAISREDAFEFPDSNIITRSLCDGGPKAKPESLMRPYELCNNDIVLLCTDGLCGMIRDTEIESIIRNNEQDMSLLVDDLIKGACDAEGADNITICLCQILEGGAKCNPSVFIETEKRLNGKQPKPMITTMINGNGDGSNKKKHIIYAVCIAAILLIGGFSTWYFLGRQGKTEKQTADAVEDSVKRDSISKAVVNANDSNKNRNPEPEENFEPDKDETKGTGKNNGIIAIPKIKDPKDGKPSKPDEDGKGGAQPVEGEGSDKDLTPILGEDGKPIKTAIGKEKNKAKEKDKAKEAASIKTYKVVDGDTYYSLAKKFGTTDKALSKLNKGKALKVGDVILVPSK